MAKTNTHAIAGNATQFMLGVALFDEMLREACLRSDSWDEVNNYSPGHDSMKLNGQSRSGQRLTLYALPFIQRLIERPEITLGFAGALGDYVGTIAGGLCPDPGAQYERLTFEDCVRVVPRASKSNVLRFPCSRDVNAT